MAAAARRAIAAAEAVNHREPRDFRNAVRHFCPSHGSFADWMGRFQQPHGEHLAGRAAGLNHDVADGLGRGLGNGSDLRVGVRLIPHRRRHGKPDGSLQVGRVYEHNRLRPFFASPVRRGDHIYGFDQMDLVCMNVRTGVIDWREKAIRTFKKGSLIAADGQLIIVGESGTLSSVEANPAGYVEKATCRVSPTRCWTPPALADGRLYVWDDAQIICFDLRK